VSQLIAIDGVFIATSDLKNTLLHKIQKGVIDIAWVTTISQSIHKGENYGTWTTSVEGADSNL
jgi:hypothetical protein